MKTPKIITKIIRLPVISHAAGLLKIAVPAAVGFAAANPGIVPPQYSAAAGLLIAGYTALHTQNKIVKSRGLIGPLDKIMIKFKLWFPAHPNRATTPQVGKIAVVAAGLTRVDPAKYNGWEGECPGCDIDIYTVEKFLKDRADTSADAILLTNERATKKAFSTGIVAAGNKLNPNTDMLVVYNSCHGGYTADKNGDESDGQDETICLYDGQWLDDDVAACLSALPNGLRVLFISDSCHSGTNTRSGQQTMTPVLTLAAPIRSPGIAGPRVLHFAGCSDKNFSYGGSNGGVFTNTLQRVLTQYSSRGITYREFFQLTKNSMPKNQTPMLTESGISFADEIIFRPGRLK